MSEETKFERADNYDTMLREINERGERIKKLGEEIRHAFDEGAYFALTSPKGSPTWSISRAKRVAEGLE